MCYIFPMCCNCTQETSCLAITILTTPALLSTDTIDHRGWKTGFLAYYYYYSFGTEDRLVDIAIPGLLVGMSVQG